MKCPFHNIHTLPVQPGLPDPCIYSDIQLGEPATSRSAVKCSTTESYPSLFAWSAGWVWDCQACMRCLWRRFVFQKEEGKVQGQLNNTDSSQYIRDLKDQISELKDEVGRKCGSGGPEDIMSGVCGEGGSPKWLFNPKKTNDGSKRNHSCVVFVGSYIFVQVKKNIYILRLTPGKKVLTTPPGFLSPNPLLLSKTALGRAKPRLDGLFSPPGNQMKP